VDGRYGRLAGEAVGQVNAACKYCRRWLCAQNVFVLVLGLLPAVVRSHLMSCPQHISCKLLRCLSCAYLHAGLLPHQLPRQRAAACHSTPPFGLLPHSHSHACPPQVHHNYSRFSFFVLLCLYMLALTHRVLLTAFAARPDAALLHRSKCCLLTAGACRCRTTIMAASHSWPLLS
jgi:hypothetical protein